MKKAQKEERPKKQAKRELDERELCRAMAGLGGCFGEACVCSVDCGCSSTS